MVINETTIMESGFGANANYSFLGVMPVATMVAVSTVSMIVVSLITKSPEEEHLKRFFACKDFVLNLVAWNLCLGWHVAPPTRTLSTGGCAAGK